MNRKQTKPEHHRRRWSLFALLLLLLGMAACGPEVKTLRPFVPTPDPDATIDTFFGQPITVTFPGLNEDAATFGVNTQYRNEIIKVTGAFISNQPLSCGREPTNGPAITWALIAENLRLEARGLEQIIPLVPEGAQLTVIGVWRVYEGPLGCGKEPERGALFYLEVQQIIEPNPLPFTIGDNPAPISEEGIDIESGGSSDPPSEGEEGSTEGIVLPPPGVPNPTEPASEGGGAATPTIPPQPIIPTSTPRPGATNTPIPTSVPPTATPTSSDDPTNTPTPTASNTPPPGATLTPTPTSTPLGQATTPPTNTPDPDSYPLPTETPTPDDY